MKPGAGDTLPLNLEALLLLVRIADLSSISAAARALDLTPSVATRKLAKLERTLNVRLFERTTRSLKLTEPGRIAVQWARRTLDAYDEAIDHMGSVVKQPSGTIRLAVNHYTERVYLSGVLARFCRSYPQIRLAVTVTDSIVHLVEDGYDVAIHSGSLPDGNVVGIKVREFKRILCGSPAYLEQRGIPRRPADLAQHDCLTHSAKEQATWFFRRGKNLISQTIRPYIEADTNVLLVELAREGLGIVRMGHDVVANDLAAGTLLEIMPDYESVYSTGELPGLWLIYPNRRVLYRTRVLIDFLSAELEQSDMAA